MAFVENSMAANPAITCCPSSSECTFIGAVTMYLSCPIE
jgi:hypothetical protein